jgi:hypothetical protein
VHAADAPAEAQITPRLRGAVTLPAGTRLLHIGPPGTGAATIQGAFHAARRATTEQGVRYAGSTVQPVLPVLAVTGRAGPTTGRPPSKRHWQALVRDVTSAGEDRVVISSELFADAEPDAIRTIVRDLGKDRVHVAVTLRPLAAVIPWQWQQFVQQGLRTSLDDWLRAMLDAADATQPPTFWHRQRHDRLVARWAEVVGSEHVTVVATDEADATGALLAFEGLVGLAAGTLVASDDPADRAMTLPEVEVVRAFNELFRQEGLGTALHEQVMRYGSAPYVIAREPAAGEPAIELPGWSAAAVTAIAHDIVTGIAASGVRVIGTLEPLARVPEPGRADAPDPAITPEIAAAAAVGVVLATGLARGGAARIPITADTPEDPIHDPDPFIPRPTIEPLALVRMSAFEIMGVLVRRAVSAVTGRLRIGGRRPG